MGRLDGKVAVVTGGASGLGEATARVFHAEGARVVVADVADDLAETLADELGSGVVHHHCDVTEEADVAAAVVRAVEDFGGLDIMLNNAGIGGTAASILDLPVDDFDHTIAVDLRSVFLGIKHAGRAMRDRGGGSIINTASAAAHFAGATPHAYCAAKGGVLQLTRSAAMELAESGIRVNSISPGMFFTRIYSNVIPPEQVELARQFFADGTEATNPMHRMGEPVEIANTALWLASDESSYVNAEDIVVDGGGLRGVRWSNSIMGLANADI